MTEIKTDESLLKRLKAAAQRPMTEQQVKEQRVSFILGMVGESSNVTREKVESVLARQEGKAAAA